MVVLQFGSDTHDGVTSAGPTPGEATKRSVCHAACSRESIRSQALCYQFIERLLHSKGIFFPDIVMPEESESSELMLYAPLFGGQYV